MKEASNTSGSWHSPPRRTSGQANPLDYHIITGFASGAKLRSDTFPPANRRAKDDKASRCSRECLRAVAATPAFPRPTSSRPVVVAAISPFFVPAVRDLPFSSFMRSERLGWVRRWLWPRGALAILTQVRYYYSRVIADVGEAGGGRRLSPSSLRALGILLGVVRCSLP